MIVSGIRAFLLIVIIPASGLADDCGLYRYRAKVIEVIDGDTVRADVDLGFRMQLSAEVFRLDGIDAPETRAYGTREVGPEERVRGLAAKAALAVLVEGRAVEICTLRDRRGKYGRYLARIDLDGLDVNQWMLDQGHALPYPERSAGLD